VVGENSYRRSSQLSNVVIAQSGNYVERRVRSSGYPGSQGLVSRNKIKGLDRGRRWQTGRFGSLAASVWTEQKPPLTSHVGIIWSAAAFGHYPSDILLRIFDVAGFAVNAILIVDLKAWVISVDIAENLKRPRGTISLRRLIKEW
jgi:hypothetical protein